ncbi:MAG: hypothetical protein ACFNL6_02960 [Candidatus Nanoperiomorbus sp.]
MDNDKQDQGAVSASAGDSAHRQDQISQLMSSDNTTKETSSPAPSPFGQVAQPSTGRSKKLPVKIIVAISLALILIVGGTLAFLHLTNPDRIVREALEADADQSDRAVKYAVEVKPSQPSTASGELDWDSIRLQGEAGWLGQKKQGSGTANINITGKGKTMKLGEVGLATNQGKLYVKLDNTLVHSYFQAISGNMNLASQSTEQSISEDSPDVKVNTPNDQSGQLQGLIKTIADVLVNRWIELDLSKLDNISVDRSVQCSDKLMSNLSKREAKLEMIKILMESKFLNIRNAGTEGDSTIYQVTLNADAWAKVAKKLEGTAAYKDLHKCLGEAQTDSKSSDGESAKKCIDGPAGTKCGGGASTNEVEKVSSNKAINSVKQSIKQSGFSAKLWVKGLLIGKHRIAKYNVKTKLFDKQKNITADYQLDLTVERLDKRPNVTIPSDPITLDKLQGALAGLLGTSLSSEQSL